MWLVPWGDRTWLCLARVRAVAVTVVSMTLFLFSTSYSCLLVKLKYFLQTGTGYLKGGRRKNFHQVKNG